MKRKKHFWIFLGFLLGTAGGAAAHIFAEGSPELASAIKYVSQPVGQIFMRLLFALLIPLVFSALAIGVYGLGDLRTLGRIGLKTFIYTVGVSAVAVLIGIVAVNVFKPGEGLSEETKAKLLQGASERAAALGPAMAPKGGIDLIVQIVPDNPVRAAATGDLLAVLFFSLLIGIGLSLTPTENAIHFRRTLEGLYDVSMRLIGMVISFAPVGVAALMFTLTAQLGIGVLTQLGKYVLVVVGALSVHQFVVYPLLLRTLGGVNPVGFFKGIQEAMLTAFSTASSSATLPTALKVAEENLKLPPNVSRFVLTLGSTVNQNGTALFEGVTVLFLAQFYGVHLTIAQQVMVVFVCILGGIGTAGVPAGSIPVVAMILGLVGVPVEGIGVILGVDRFLDMCRTTLNVTGDLAAAVVISKGERKR